MSAILGLLGGKVRGAVYAALVALLAWQAIARLKVEHDLSACKVEKERKASEAALCAQRERDRASVAEQDEKRSEKASSRARDVHTRTVTKVVTIVEHPPPATCIAALDYLARTAAELSP